MAKEAGSRKPVRRSSSSEPDWSPAPFRSWRELVLGSPFERWAEDLWGERGRLPRPLLPKPKAIAIR